MDEQQARDVIERYWQAAQTRDFDTVRRLFRDDVLIEWPQSGERVHGKESCINVSSTIRAAAPPTSASSA